MRKLLVAIVVLITLAGVWGSERTAAAANTEIDYFGTNLFLGIAYHRWGCALNGPYSNSTVTTNNTYQGFTQTQYCHPGWTWAQENSSASTWYGYSNTGNLSDSWLGYYFCNANYAYGEAMANMSTAQLADWHNYCHSWQGTQYANNSAADRTDRDPSGAINYCSYVLTNCNSDCWIAKRSVRACRQLKL